MTDTLLETDDLVKEFGELTANDHIDVQLERGEIRGLIGPNGSGKTTFFNTLTGYHELDGGTVTFDGTDITGWPTYRIARQGLGRTFQIVSPFENMTVRENLLAVETPDGVDKQVRSDEILEFLELRDIADHDASGMSGGQQKLLEMGRVLMLDPDCILLDEPTAGVNPVLAEKIGDYIQTLNDRGTTFFIIEHDMTWMSEIADTISVLAQGQHIATGSFEEVKQRQDVREAYLGSAAAEV